MKLHLTCSQQGPSSLRIYVEGGNLTLEQFSTLCEWAQTVLGREAEAVASTPGPKPGVFLFRRREPAAASVPSTHPDPGVPPGPAPER